MIDTPVCPSIINNNYPSPLGLLVELHADRVDLVDSGLNAIPYTDTKGDRGGVHPVRLCLRGCYQFIRLTTFETATDRIRICIGPRHLYHRGGCWYQLIILGTAPPLGKGKQLAFRELFSALDLDNGKALGHC